MYGIKDFKRLKNVAKKTGCKIQINSKNGIPFFMNKYRKRKAFLICLILLTVFLFAESRFIWNIQIEGIDRISEEEIRNALLDAGLGVRKE